jgi:galactose-1-phosphate uridylyltransferase
MDRPLTFTTELITARFIGPDGDITERDIEIRTNPVTFRTSRVTLSRVGEKEKETESLPEPPPDADQTDNCPFCRPQVEEITPQCLEKLAPAGRLSHGKSLLFPNLFPYGAYSAVSLFDNNHFVEIGTASVRSYRDSFLNCADYLRRIHTTDPQAGYMAITQNHLPSAGGSLLHPHLQINVDRTGSNHHRFLAQRATEYLKSRRSRLFADYLQHEKKDGSRYIGTTGNWQWLTAFAPEGFYELWGILPDCISLMDLKEQDWEDLARGVINTQKFYRSLCRNGYNLGLLMIEDGNDSLEMRIVILVRSNYAPWARNDHTGFEIMLGDMATFIRPEETARLARRFWLPADEIAG